MTCYNGSETISETIDSILDQSIKPTEIIVVDDGSTDSSIEVLKRYEGQIRIIERENGGPSRARNTGIELANGPWIALCDGDDLWHRGKLEQQINTAKENPDISIFATSWRRSFHELSLDNKKHHLVDRQRLLKLNQFQTSTVLIKKSIFDEVGFFDPTVDVAEDWEMWIRAALISKIYVDDAPLVMYRDSPKGVSKDLTTLFKKCSLVMEKAFDSGGVSPSQLATLLAWHRQRILIGQILTKNIKPAIEMATITLRSTSPLHNATALTKYTIPFLLDRFTSN